MDVDAWSKALESLATDADLRARLVASGRAHAATFTWDRSARAALSALERVARPRPKG
jgi:glycosyltransferase involved in cell wall biosynthesis